MRTKKAIKRAHNKTYKKNNLKTDQINNFRKNIYIKKQYKADFISSCFKYYYGELRVCSKTHCSPLVLSKSFLETKNKGQLLIIDYPNVIYTLHEHYNNKESVIQHFYFFVLKQLERKTKLYIISKKVAINGDNFAIDYVFNEGARLTQKMIPKKYFDKEHINIYDLNYNTHFSSSIDDLLGHFICFVLFVYLWNQGKARTSLINKLSVITNDKQFFNKNLFGLTQDELKNHIQMTKDLSIYRLSIKNNKYVFVYNDLDKQLISEFLSEYVVTKATDTAHLEKQLDDLFYTYSKTNNIKNMDFSYDNLVKNKSDHNLKHHYYLYFFIKYVQKYLNKGDYYGSKSKEEIIRLVR
jgi:hypothetical protein